MHNQNAQKKVNMILGAIKGILKISLMMLLRNVLLWRGGVFLNLMRSKILGITNSVVAYMDKNGAIKYVKIKNEILILSNIFFKNKKDVYFWKKVKTYAMVNESRGGSVFVQEVF